MVDLDQLHLGGGAVEDVGGGDQFGEQVVRTAPCACAIFPDGSHANTK